MTAMLFSCTSENVEGYVIIDTSMEIIVKDKDGSDLLNPDNENSLNTNLVKIYYEIGGKKIEVNEPHLDNPKGFSIFCKDNQYRIGIGPNTDRNEEYPLTYIEWNPDDTDTIKCLIERAKSRNGNSTICRKVWFNGKVVWDDYGVERSFVIVK